MVKGSPLVTSTTSARPQSNEPPPGGRRALGRLHTAVSDQAISILDLARLVISKVDPAVEIRFVPYCDAYGDDFEDVQRRVPNTDRLLNTIGMRPTMPLDQILDDIIAWKRS